MSHHALFICSRNRLRSPTAEQVFADWPGVRTSSAGLSPDADVPVTADALAWADTIFVMERVHRSRLAAGRPQSSRQTIQSRLESGAVPWQSTAGNEPGSRRAEGG